MELSIEAPTHVRAGRLIPIALRLENRTQRPVTLPLLGRTMTFDIIVREEGGREVFRLLRGSTAAAILRLEHVEPGEIRHMSYRWDQQTDDGRAARPGHYAVEALLPTDGEPIRAAPVPLRILPR